MSKPALALLIHENPGAGGPARDALGHADPPFAVQGVNQIGIAVARLAGGGIDLMVLEAAPSEKPEIEILDHLLQLRSAAPQVPLILVGEYDDQGVLQRAIRAGSAEHLPPERCAAELAPLAQACLQRAHTQPRQHLQRPLEFSEGAATLALVGSKGGAGTTTVALNVAAFMARSRRVVLAELRPAGGTLRDYFHVHGATSSLAHLLELDPVAISPLEVENCLWQSKKIPSLAILFAPPSCGSGPGLTPESARAIRRSLSTLADFVLLDLPPWESEANRVLIQESDRLVLLLERAPLSVERGKHFLEAIETWNAAPALLGAVVVNRAALAAPMDLGEIERQLAIPLLAVIPPAPDLCASAEAAGIPLIACDPDSLAAQSLTALAGRLLSKT